MIDGTNTKSSEGKSINSSTIYTTVLTKECYCLLTRCWALCYKPDSTVLTTQ